MVEYVVKERTKTPWHLWVVGVLALLWSAGGALDYTATKLEIEGYMSQFTQEQLDYFYGFPVWMVTAWACAVWGSVAASLMLLLRRAWALPLYGLSIVGLFVSSIYSLVLSNGMDIMGTEGAIFTAVIWVITIALYYYARRMVKRRVLI
jgi:hypothetical protein